MVLPKAIQHFQGRHRSHLLEPSGERWPHRSQVGHVPTSRPQYPSLSSREPQAHGGPHPHLPAALSATQHCLLAQCLERGVLPQQLELVRTGAGAWGRAGLRPLWTQTTTAATRRLIQGLGWVPALCRVFSLGLRTQAGQVETPTGDHRQCPERETRWVLCSLCWQLSGPRGVPERGPLHAIQELMDEEMGWVSSQNAYAFCLCRILRMQGLEALGVQETTGPRQRREGRVWGARSLEPQFCREQGPRLRCGGGGGWGGAWAPVIRGPRLPPSGQVPLLPALGDLCARPG